MRSRLKLSKSEFGRIRAIRRRHTMRKVKRAINVKAGLVKPGRKNAPNVDIGFLLSLVDRFLLEE